MSVQVVTFQLANPGDNHTHFMDMLEKHVHIQLSDSSYVITTNKTPSTTFREFEPCLKPGDQVYIMTVRKPHSLHGSTANNDWLDARLA